MAGSSVSTIRLKLFSVPLHSNTLNILTMRILLTIAAYLSMCFVCHAQCEENISGQQMQKGMFLFCDPGAIEAKKYVAEVVSVNGNSFSCRFLHSNSVYQFTDFKRAADGPATRMQATVQSNKGGGYVAGTIFKINVFMPDPVACDLSGATGNTAYDVIATFKADGKSFLGRIQKNSKGYTIKFAHTQSVYTVDNNFKVLTVTGGGYSVGSQMKVVHARILAF
jgi:hypothetical protein